MRADTSHRDLVINAAYLGGADGTAAVTECVIDAYPGMATIRPRFDPALPGRIAFRRKVAYELAFRRHSATLRVHPYAACALDTGAAVLVLDALATHGSRRHWHTRLLRRCIARADRVATISESERQRLSRLFAREFAVLTPYPARAFFESPPTPRRRRERVLRVGYWGGWHPRKDILRRLAEVAPADDVRFYVTGSPQPQLAGRGDITWLGRVTLDELVALLDFVDVALYPSVDEGFGLPPYEALLRGRPVILRELGCYADYLASWARPGVITLSEAVGLAEALDASRASPPVAAPEYLQTPDLDSARRRLGRQLEEWLSA
jgi:glycosyltransferase involved in cell wall biosynthesis